MTNVELAAKLRKAASLTSLPELPVIVQPDELPPDGDAWPFEDSVMLTYGETGEVDNAYWVDGFGLPVKL